MNKSITYSGKLIDIFNISIEDIDILDIAYGLSNIPRFAGQVPFYSVAKHSLVVASFLPEKLKLAGLLHDASEAYIGDVISPIKHKMQEYLDLEEQIMEIISKKWQIDPSHILIKQADTAALEQEKSILFFKKDTRTEDQAKTMSCFLDVYRACLARDKSIK